METSGVVGVRHLRRSINVMYVARFCPTESRLDRESEGECVPGVPSRATLYLAVSTSNSFCLIVRPGRPCSFWEISKFTPVCTYSLARIWAGTKRLIDKPINKGELRPIGIYSRILLLSILSFFFYCQFICHLLFFE